MRRVIALKSVPAADLAKTVSEAFKVGRPGGMPGAYASAGHPPGGPTIIGDAMSNSVVVCTSRAEMEEIVQMIEMLDRPPSLVYVEVAVARLFHTTPPAAKADPAAPPAIAPRATAPQTAAGSATAPTAPPGRRVDASASQRMSDVIARLNNDPSLAAMYHIQLTTLDGQPAYAQYGRREPRVMGVAHTGSMGTSRSVSMENVGQLVKLTPRVDPNGAIALQIDVEGSEIARDAEGVVIDESPKGGQTRASPVQTSMLQTTVTVRDGEVITLSGLNSRRGDRTEQTVCYVTARAVRPGENARRPDAPRRSETRRPRDTDRTDRPVEEPRLPYTRPSETRVRPETFPHVEPIRPVAPVHPLGPVRPVEPVRPTR